MSEAFRNEPPIDMTKLTRRPRRSWRRFLIVGIIFVCVAAAVAGFVVFTRAERFTGKSVYLNLGLPETVASGSEVTLTIRAENDEAVTLKRVQVAVTYPDGFTYANASLDPLNEAKNAFALGDLKPGIGRELEITGRLVGDVETERTFTATLSYMPETFSSEFTAEVSSTLTLADSVLDVAFDGPARVVPDADVAYTVTYTNRSAGSIPEARVNLVLPDGFTVSSSEPSIGENRTWAIRDLAKNAGGTLTVRGKFTGEVGSLRELVVRAGLIASDGTFKLQTEKRLIVQLVRPEVTFGLSINNSDEDGSTTFGSALKYLLRYVNATDEVVKDIEVRLTIDGPLVDWSSLEASPEGRPQRDGTTLVWTKAEVPTLGELAPNGDGELTLTIRTAEAPVEDGEAGKTVVSRALLRGSASELGGTIEMADGPLTLKVNTVVQLTTEARYYSNDFTKLGDGPLPPREGSTTRYRLVWSLENTINDVTGVSVATTIPNDVFWTGRSVESSSGNLVFDPETREVRWSLDRIPAGVGTKTDRLTAQFELSVTPTASDVGRAVSLTDGTELIGTDAFTGAKLTEARDALTTNLDADQYARGQGEVQPAEDASGVPDQVGDGSGSAGNANVGA